MGAAGAIFFLGRLSAQFGGRLIPLATAGRSELAKIGSRGFSMPSDGRGSPAEGNRSKELHRKHGDRYVDLAMILRQPDSIDRNRALMAWMDQLDPAEIKGALERFRSLGLTGKRQSEYLTLLEYWAKKDPTAALEDAAAQTNNDRSVRTILGTWALNDPDAALAWVLAAHPGNASNSYLPDILGSLASSDPARTTEILQGMPPGKEQDRAISEILRSSLIQSPETAQMWISSLQDSALRANAVVQVAGDMAQIDPQGTAAWLQSLEGPAAEEGVLHMMAVWNDKDSAAATAYYESMPPGAGRSNALGGLISSIAQSDPRAAAALLDSYPEDATDASVTQLVRSSAKSDPELAADYISRIADPQQQEDAFNRVLSRWIRHDQAAATAWIQANPVPPEIRRNLGL